MKTCRVTCEFHFVVYELIWAVQSETEPITAYWPHGNECRMKISQRVCSIWQNKLAKSQGKQAVKLQ